MTKITLIKANISLGLDYSFRGSVHYHDGKQGSTKADTLLEEELRVEPQSARRLSSTDS